MIRCSDAVKQLWDYIEDAVEGPERAALEEHLSVCRRCCGEMEFAEELRRFLAEHGDADLPPEVRDKFHDFLEQI